MEAERTHAARTPLVLGLVAALVGCTGEHHSSTHVIPVFQEAEPNDSAFQADDFGVLRPGDDFIIRGHVSDVPFDPFDPFNGYDPYDGFAFTAGQPIHVEFALHAETRGADLDVCLYDPQLGVEVGCFATGNDPELGAADVLASGFSFHLVVQSFIGTSSYTLEIRVFPLAPDTAAPRAPAASAGVAGQLAAVPAVVAPGGGPAADPAHGEGRLVAYALPRRAAEAHGAALRRLRALEISAESGKRMGSSIVLLPDGTRMGIQGEATE